MAKKWKTFTPEPPKRIHKDEVAARLPSVSVCGKGHVFKAGTTCGQCP